MKKITIVGRGTVGCLAVTHFLRWTDCEIEWIFDPSIEPTPVGEGTNLKFPRTLSRNLDFDFTHLDEIGSVPKLGIWKRGWAKGKDFIHPFTAGNIGIHFSAIQFQDYVYKKILDDPKISIVEDNVVNYENLDSDFVMVCTGSPRSFDGEYELRESIPVNSAMVFQCPWDLPKFLYSLTFAKKYGWVFGIPLKNRCAIGYVYNDKFCNEEDIKEDVQAVLNEFDLTPSYTRKLKFNNYVRKQNFYDRICYNGNASFFLEPLEATSTGTSDFVNRLAFDFLIAKEKNLQQINFEYTRELDEIESMICLHYLSGSVYKNDFWNYAKNLAENKIQKDFLEKNDFYEAIKFCFNRNHFSDNLKREVGTWNARSLYLNIKNLGLESYFKKLL